jgi:magnesium-protoporphyrin O-methyltransferase
MTAVTYKKRREEIENYFDRTAADTWARLTSDAPVSGIRKTVRAGRDRMRSTILSWLPEDLNNKQLFDAGCGTGALSIEAAQRGASVVGKDLAANLIEVANKRIPETLQDHKIEFLVGDMSINDSSQFDYIVCMDSLIHYSADDAVRTLVELSKACTNSIIFTFAPSSFPLEIMHSVGRLFPRGDRAPSIVPVNEKKLVKLITAEPCLQDWKITQTKRIKSGFYTSQAMQLVHRSSV